MKRDRIEEGRFTENGRGLGTVTRAMVHKRAAELALISGRSEKNILESDWNQAYHELTGTERLVPEAPLEEDIPEDARNEGIAGSTGHQVEPVPSPDEQTFAEKLVEEGVEDAELDQMVKATKESLRREREG
jgi:hypothetical protein